MPDEEGYHATTEGGEVVLGTYTVDLSATIIPREDNSVVLVLDRSGSMAAAAGGSNTRSGLLKSAVGVFHFLLRSTDEIGVVSFDDVTENLLPLTAQSAGLGSTLTGNGLDPRGATGIGLGIQAGAAMLAGAAHGNRSLLVLTDGNQNVHPYVEELAGGTVTNRTYAIGFGLPGEVSDSTLNAITHNTQGDLVITGALAADEEGYLLKKYFVQMLAGITSANVVLDPEDELLLGSEHATPFVVTEADVSIDVILLSSLAPLIEFVLRTPVGTMIDPGVAAAEPNISFHVRPDVAVYRLELPALPADPGGSHAGTWTILAKIRDEEGLARLLRTNELRLAGDAIKRLIEKRSLGYSCIVHARSNLDFSARASQRDFSLGSPVSLSASLREYGVPFAGEAEVFAEVTAPDSAGFVVPLTRSGAGAYAASFAASAPGVYRVRVRARGATSLGSVFTREKSLTASAYVGRQGYGDGGGGRRGSDGGPQEGTGMWCALFECLARWCRRRHRRPVEPVPQPVRHTQSQWAAAAPAPEAMTARMADFIAEASKPVVHWPSAAARRERAEKFARLREEMAKHPDRLMMMSPPIDDKGRPIAHEHGPDCPPDCGHEAGHDHGGHDHGPDGHEHGPDCPPDCGHETDDGQGDHDHGAEDGDHDHDHGDVDGDGDGDGGHDHGEGDDDKDHDHDH